MKKASTKSPRRPSISMLLLDHLACRPDGMSFTELQRFAFSLHVLTDPNTHPDRPMPRGWWCDPLCGSMWNHVGLLATFATKGSDGRWYRNSVPHGGKPWTIVERTPNRARAELGHKY